MNDDPLLVLSVVFTALIPVILLIPVLLYLGIPGDICVIVECVVFIIALIIVGGAASE